MGDEIINGDTRLPGEGDTYSSTMHRAECVLCGEPATRKYCWLLKGFRSNPQSKAYGRDDCTWCSDAEAFYCEPCRKDARPPDGYEAASIFPCTTGFAHMFLVMGKSVKIPAVPKEQQ